MPKYIPTTTTTKKRGPKPKKPRSIIGSCAEAVSEPKRPFVTKITFNPKPTWKMTDEEAYAFACRQAQEAADHIRTKDGHMTEGDVQKYAAAVYQSILYFNKRDPRHKDHMRYLEELRENEEERKKAALLVQLEAKILAAMKP